MKTRINTYTKGLLSMILALALAVGTLQYLSVTDKAYAAQRITSYTVHVPAATHQLCVQGDKVAKAGTLISLTPAYIVNRYANQMITADDGYVLNFWKAADPDAFNAYCDSLTSFGQDAQGISGLNDETGSYVPWLTVTDRAAYDTTISAADYEALEAFHEANPDADFPGTAYPMAYAAYQKIAKAAVDQGLVAFISIYQPSLSETNAVSSGGPITFTPNYTDVPDPAPTAPGGNGGGSSDPVTPAPAPTVKAAPTAADFTFDHTAIYSGKTRGADLRVKVAGVTLKATVYYDPAGSKPKTTALPKAAGKYTVYAKTPRQTINGITYAASALLKLGTFTLNPKKAAKVSKLKSGKGKLYVYWSTQKASANTTGYQIAYKVKGSSKWYYKTVKGSTSAKYTLKLAKHKRYYVKVRVYKRITANTPDYTLYSSWTATKLSPKTK
jgi:hypothetical protein